MAKISELPPITGDNTRSEDLFVIVNLVQGDDGTSNITRKELVQAIQYEVFDRITITGGDISGAFIHDLRIDRVIIDNSDIEDTNFERGTIDDTVITNSDANNLIITSSEFNIGEINDSTANNVIITQSEFNDGEINDSTGNNVVLTNSELNDSTANNVVITNSEFNDGSIEDSTANNIVITNSEFTDGEIFDSTGNNVVLTNSELNDSTANNVVITDSQFNDGTGNNVVLTRSTIDTSVFTNGEIEDSVASNVVITDSEFNNGTGNNVVLTNSTIDDSTITDSTADNLEIANSTFTDGAIEDSTANNVTITQSDLDNVEIINSDFSDGTGNNNVFTNTTIDQGTIQNSEITNSSFTGTMDNVVAQNMTITSSSADGFSQTRSTFDSGDVTKSTFDNGIVKDSTLVDFDMDLNDKFEPPLDQDSYFAIKNEKTGQTEQISYSQLFDEVSKSTAQALKVHVDAASGNDDNPGTMLQPVQSMERAFELCLEKAGGSFDRNALNNSVHISAGPGTYYTKGNLMLPDDCSVTSTSGQYATVIEALPGYENNNAILVGSGCYVQGFSYMNWKIDNFDFPEGGFAVAYRPGAKLLRSPYLRDSTQLSNFVRSDVEPPLNPYNTKGTLADLGREFTLEVGMTGQNANPALSLWQEGDEVTFSSGAVGYLSWDDSMDAAQGIDRDVDQNRKIRVRNLKNNRGFAVGDTVQCESGGTGTVASIGIDDFPNRLVGRGGGCVLADRRVLDPDSLYTYVLCFGFTPRTQNGIGYVARDGAGVNGIGSLSIFVRIAFYALNGGQMTLNNSGTQFGDISMRAKGTTRFFAPKSTSAANIFGNTAFADTIEANEPLIIDDMVDFITANTASGGLGYKGYDADKCERDSKIILDGLGYDIALDSNYWGRLAGISYRSPISYVVPGEQLEETLGANEYMQARVQDLFEGDPAIVARANTSMQELYNVLQYGEENINPITWVPTSVEQTAARELLQDNRTFIQTELTNWIDNNDQFYSYDSVACRRDTTDYIMPAVKNDMLLDTNYNAVTAGNAYYMASASKVIGEQRNETIGAYRFLKDRTNEILDANSYISSARVDGAFDEIITQLRANGATFTPTGVDYDHITGVMIMTIGTHNLEPGDKILFKPESILLACEGDGSIGQIAHPRALGGAGRPDPCYNTPCEITDVGATTITINAGVATVDKAHTFVSALPNAISVLGAEITFSDDAGILEARRDSRKLLQANREFMQDSVLNYIDTNYFHYDNIACRRDVTDYILPAVQRDMVTGSNYNAIQAGIAYRQKTGESTILNELPQTVAAIEDLQFNTRQEITDNVGVEYGAQFTPSNATYDPNTGIFVATVGTHSLEPGDYVWFADNGITMSCDMGSGATNHTSPAAHHPFYRKPCLVTEVDATTITMNVGTGGTGLFPHTFVSSVANAISEVTSVGRNAESTQADLSFRQLVDIVNNTGKTYTPTGVTYDPVTGMMISTIGDHDLQPGQEIVLADSCITFTCPDAGGNPVSITHPRPTDPVYRKPIKITATSSTTFTCYIGPAGTDKVHTFVSATADCVKEFGYSGTYTPQNATYDPNTGVFVASIGKHNVQVGDYVEIKPESVVFSCDNGNGPEDHASPEQHHPFYKKPVLVTAVTTTSITMNVGAGGGYTGVHTFVSADVGAIIADPLVWTDPSSYLNYYTPTTATYDPATGVSVVTIPDHDLAIGDRIEFTPYSFTYTCSLDSNATEHQYPRVGDGNYKTAMEITNVAGNNITVNVGTGSGGTHTFVSVANDAVIKVTTNTAGQLAREQLQANRNMIQTEIMEYLDTQYFVFDGDKCSRDTGFIVDAARRSVATGSNYPAIYMGLGYRIGTVGADKVVNDQLTETVGAINYLKSEVSEELTGTALTRSNDAFDEIIDILSNGSGNADTIVWGTNAVDVAHANARVALQTNKTFIQAETVAHIADTYPNLTYDTAKCLRDTGYMIDAISWDIQHGSNAGAVNFARLYFENAMAVLPEDQVVPTVRTWEYIAEVCYSVIRAIAITPTTGNVQTQDVSGGDLGIILGNKGRDLVTVVTKTIEADTLDWLPSYVEPTIEAGFETAVARMDGKTENLQTDVIEHIINVFNGLPYNKAKCFRDIGHIIDSVSKDIEYGGNASTIESAAFYFSRDDETSGDYEQLRSVNVLPLEVKGQMRDTAEEYPTANVSGLRTLINVLPEIQRVPTRLAFERLADVAEKVVTETAITPSSANVPAQDTSGTAAPAATGTAVHDLIQAVAALVDDKTADYIPKATNPTVDPNRTVARKQIQMNKDFIAEDVVEYLRERYYTFDGEKCYRDMAILINAVKRDVLTDSNFNAVFNGLAYRIGTKLADNVITEQLTETVSAIEYTRDAAVAAVTDPTAKTKTLNSFNELIDIMTNGETAADNIVFGPSSSRGLNGINAREQLKNNKAFMQAEITAYLADNYPSYVYDVAKCERDVGYLTDCVIFDTYHSGNSAVRGNAKLYFENAVSVLPVDQQAKTAETFIHIAEVAKYIVQDQDVDGLGLKSSSNSATQNRDSGSAGLAVGNEVERLFSVVANAISNNSLESMPALEEPNSASNAYVDEFKTAFTELEAVIPSVQDGLYAHLAEYFEILPYSEDKCRRDTKYILDGISHDIQYGGNAATLGNAKLYFDNAVNTLPLEQREASKFAFTHMSELVEKIVQRQEIPLRPLDRFGVSTVAYDPVSGEMVTTTLAPHTLSLGDYIVIEKEGITFECNNPAVEISHPRVTDPVYRKPLRVSAVTATTFTVNVEPAGGYTQAHSFVSAKANAIIKVSNPYRQELGNVAGNPMIATRAKALGMIITNVVETGSYATFPTRVDPLQTWQSPTVIAGKEAVEDAVPALADNVLTYLTAVQNGLGFPGAKCRRDIGYLIDAVSHDVQYGGNFASRQSAGIYFENGVSVLPADTRKQTADIYDYLGLVMSQVVQENDVSQFTTYTPTNATYDPASGVFTATIGSNNFKVGDLVWFAPESIVFSCNMGSGNQNHRSPESHHPYYNRGCPITAVEGTTITMNVGTGGTGQVAHTFVTADADSLANGPYQQFLGTPGTATEAAAAQSLIGIVEDVIRANSTDALPGLEGPDLSWVNSELIGAAEQIEDNVDHLANDLVHFINTEFNALDYNRAKCFRDVGYLLDAFSYDLNYGGNIASRWNADFYFWNNEYRVPENQREATAKSYRQLGVICKDIVLGKYAGQVAKGELGTQVEADKVEKLANVFYLTQINKDTKYLPAKQEPDYAYAGDKFTGAQFIIGENKINLAADTVRYVSAEYGFINLPLTRRDASNLLQAIANDFKYEDGTEVNSPSYTGSIAVGAQNAIRTFTSSFFDYKGQHAFPVFNSTTRGLKYQGSLQGPVGSGILASVTGQKPNHAYIVATNMAVSHYEGDIYYWDPTINDWRYDGPNNTELLDSFVGAWERMRDYMISNLSPDAAHSAMIAGLFNDCLIDNVVRPETLIFGSLVESIAHQFNGASAGVNRNALPLNFRNLGQPISAIASVLNEDGGRIRWSGADELNNQYFARGLRINGRTGRIEGRPFTSSVRKLARRASNSRASL